MRKSFLIVLLILALIISGGVYLSASNSDNQAKKDMIGIGSAGPVSSPKPTTATGNTTPGAYVDYKDGVIASTSGTKLLFFHAPWCPQCRNLDASIKQNGVPEGVTIIKVDYDSNRSLRQKYGVTLQTTVVRVDDIGNIVKKFVAYDEPSIDAVKRNLL